MIHAVKQEEEEEKRIMARIEFKVPTAEEQRRALEKYKLAPAVAAYFGGVK